MNKVTEYYDETRRDYRLIWGTGSHLSMHFGYSDEDAYRHDEAVVRMIQELASRARISSSDLVLDLGCGVGGSSIWLAQNVGCHVLGVDMNPQSLAIARPEAEKQGLSHLVSFTQADYCQLPIDSDTADVAWFLECLCYAPDKYDALREAARVLRKGGRLVVADAFIITGGKELETWLKSWAVPNLPTAFQFKKWLWQLGFINVTSEDITPNIMASCERLYRYARALYPVGKVMEKVKLRTPTQTENIIGAINFYKSVVKGQFQYLIFTAEKA